MYFCFVIDKRLDTKYQDEKRIQQANKERRKQHHRRFTVTQNQGACQYSLLRSVLYSYAYTDRKRAKLAYGVFLRHVYKNKIIAYKKNMDRNYAPIDNMHQQRYRFENILKYNIVAQISQTHMQFDSLLEFRISPRINGVCWCIALVAI